MSLILTKAGLNAYAQSEATGTKLQATHMAVGDGGGAPVAHTDTSEALVNETWRGELQKIEVTASGEVEFRGHVPITVGGWYIREVAIYADDTLLALSSHPETWKPAPEAPDKVELVITAPVKFANADNINLTVDTTKVLASQEHVAEEIASHDSSPDAHPGLMAGVAADIANHDLDPDAHQPLFDRLNATIRGLRKQVVIDKILSGAVGTGYTDGFIKDFSDAGDVVLAESSGYVHDAVEGVFRSINPALDSGDEIVDWAVAATEEIKGNVTTLTVDTADASGHFNMPCPDKVVAGCKIVTASGDVWIKSITADGTARDSIELSGTLAAGVYEVTAITGLTVENGKLQLSEVIKLGISLKDVFLNQPITASATYSSSIPENVVDGAQPDNTHWSPNYGGFVAGWLEVVPALPCVLTRYEVSQWYYQGGGPFTYNPTAWTLEGWDGTSWVQLDARSGQTDVSNLTKVGQVYLRPYKTTKHVLCSKFRLNITATPGNYIILHCWRGFSDQLPALPKNYTAIADIASFAWKTVASVAVEGATNEASAWYSCRFGTEYRIWAGSAWRAIARDNAGVWEFWTGSAWQTAPHNSPQAAISEAMTVDGNRMADAVLAALTDGNFAGLFPDGISATLYTPDASANPKVDSVTFGVTVADEPLVLTFKPQDNVTLPASSPSKILAQLGLIPQVPIDPATDLVVEVSNDDGKTYAPAVLDPAVQFVTGQYLITGVGDVSGQSGAQPKVKITVAAGRYIKADAGGAFWS